MSVFRRPFYFRKKLRLKHIVLILNKKGNVVKINQKIKAK